MEWTEEQKEKYREAMIKKFAEERSRISVIYHPDCGCPIVMDFVLDRVPMSRKIYTQCPECKKGVLAEISDPIRFYEPLSKQEFSLEDLKEGVIGESPQKYFLELYRDGKKEPFAGAYSYYKKKGKKNERQ